MTARRVIGIDLGTTYSCAAIVENGKPRVLQSRLGYSTIPSIVTFDENGKPLVGQAAERRMILNPRDVIYGHKRLLGRAFLPGVKERFQGHFQYELVPDTEGLVASRIYGRVVPLVEASALILGEIRRAAEETLGTFVERAVVTVPAYFNETQRAAVRQAAQRADLDIIRILNEPTAAALCFGFNRGEKKRILVFDLGGGTFDVSIVQLDGNVFQVLATDGDTFLGGLDFDRALVDHFLNVSGQQAKRSLVPDAITWQRLRIAAQEAKHQLSGQEKATVNLPGLTLANGAAFNLNVSVTRAEFEVASKELLDRAMAVVDRALEASRLRDKDIDEVLLVGGQTRMPIIHKLVRERFNKEPSKRVHADEVVALGAAIAADSHDRFDAAVLTDVLPLPIGIAAAGGGFYPITGRNTPVPHTATINIPCSPGRALKVAVFQGESPRAAENDYLGALVVDGIPPGETRTCSLRFEIDAECLLKVRATVPGTNIDREVLLATQQTPDNSLEGMNAERIKGGVEGGAGNTPAPVATPVSAAAAPSAAPVAKPVASPPVAAAAPAAAPAPVVSAPVVAPVPAVVVPAASPGPGLFGRIAGWFRKG